jgi:thymidylate kinase
MIKTICYLGTDCSGKDSTMHAVAKLSDYTVFSMPRSPICNIVYDAIFDRINDERYSNNMKLIAKLLEINTYFVWVYADSKCLYERGVARNEKHMDSESKYILHTRFYKAYFNLIKEIQFKNHQNRFILIDNTHLSIQETAEEVWKQIQ